MQEGEGEGGGITQKKSPEAGRAFKVACGTFHAPASPPSSPKAQLRSDAERRAETQPREVQGPSPPAQCVCLWWWWGGVPRELGLRAWGHSSPPWHGPSTFSAPGPVLRAGAKGEKDRRRSPYRASIPSPGHAVPGCVQMPPSCLSRCPGCSRGSSPLPLLCPSWRTHQLAGGVRMD